MNVTAADEDRDVDHAEISPVNLANIRGTLARLAPYFARDARVGLRGCEVARHDEGRELIRQLARIWRGKVQGTVVDQHGVNWVGPVIEASPVPHSRAHQVQGATIP